MSHRYVEASEEAVEKTNQVIEQWFPPLKLATIKVLFDTKKRTKNGKIVLGEIKKATDLIRRLTDNLAEDGCDYIMFLDQVAFANISDIDQIRLVRHELRHCKVVGTEEKPKFKLVPHDIEDFEIEIELNKDDVGWARNAAQIASDIYDQMADDKKDREGQQPEEKKEEAPAAAPGVKRFLRKKTTV